MTATSRISSSTLLSAHVAPLDGSDRFTVRAEWADGEIEHLGCWASTEEAQGFLMEMVVMLAEFDCSAEADAEVLPFETARPGRRRAPRGRRRGWPLVALAGAVSLLAAACGAA